jgi:hypothetical protein
MYKLGALASAVSALSLSRVVNVDCGGLKTKLGKIKIGTFLKSEWDMTVCLDKAVSNKLDSINDSGL